MSKSLKVAMLLVVLVVAVVGITTAVVGGRDSATEIRLVTEEDVERERIKEMSEIHDRSGIVDEDACIAPEMYKLMEATGGAGDKKPCPPQ